LIVLTRQNVSLCQDDGSQAEEDEFDDAQFDGAAEDNAGSEEKAEEGEADEEGDQDDNEEEAEAEEDGSEADGSQDQSEHDESGSQAEEDNEADDAENESGADEESDEEAELGSQSESTKPSKSKGKGKGEQSVVKSEPGAVKRKSVAAPQPQPPQRRRLAKSNFEIALEREKRAERRRRLVEYYRGSSYGSASAQVAYSLARDLQRDSNELLWLAIVGCSEQFVLERIGTERYLAAVDALANDVLKNNPALRPRRAGDDEANPLAAMGLGDDGEASQLDDDQTAVQMSHGYIAASDEYRFMLLRHWTLYDAMLHSRYVATRLTLWRYDPRCGCSCFSHLFESENLVFELQLQIER
jgi:cell division control protein 45